MEGHYSASHIKKDVSNTELYYPLSTQQKNVELLISVTFAKDGETDLKGYINIILDNDRVHVLVKKSKLFGDMKVTFQSLYIKESNTHGFTYYRSYAL